MAAPTVGSATTDDQTSFRRSGRRLWRVPIGPLPLLLTWLLTLVYAATYALQAILRHDSLGSNALDLGYEDQALWNTLHGHPYAFSLLSGGSFSLDYQAPLDHAAQTVLAYHAELLLAPLSLLYAVLPDVRALLALQAIVVCAGALAAYGLARRSLQSAWAGCLVAIAYLCSPFVEAELLSDFHPVALESALILLLFYLLERRLLPAVLLMGLLAAAAKEDAPLVVTLVGLWTLLVQRWRPAGLGLLLIGLGFTVFDFFWLIPHFSPGQASPFLARYGYLGQTPLAILIHPLRHPSILAPTLGSSEARAYFLALLGSGWAFALFAPLTLVIAAPSLAINLLSTFPWMRSGMAHYSALVLPILLVASIEGIRNIAVLLEAIRSHVLGRRDHTPAVIWRPAVLLLSAWLAGTAAFTHYQMGSGLGGHAFALALPDAHARLLPRFLAQIPATDAVSTGSSLAPHLSERQHLYLFPNVLDAQEVLLDLTGTPYPLSWSEQRLRLLALLQTGTFGVADAADGYVLLRRGAPVRNLPRTTFSFIDGPSAAINSRPLATFGGHMFLRDAHVQATSIIGAGWQETLTLDWTVDQPPAEDETLAVWTSGTPRPQPQDFQGETPALTWRATSNWQPDTVIRVVVSGLAVTQPTRLQIAWFHPKAETAGLDWLPCVDAAGQVCPFGNRFVVSALATPTGWPGSAPWRAALSLLWQDSSER
ncbi:MAG: DUF2079 domain-containing protein [Chloroflexota bacterium]